MARHIDLEDYANGALSERVNGAFYEVAKNILDPNTNAEKKRSITVTITFAPAKNRQTANIDISCKTSLAPPENVQTTMVMGKDLKTGAVDAREISMEPEVPGQYAMVGDEMVDTATGEAVPLPGGIRRIG